MNRRDFLGSLAAAGAAVLLRAPAGRAQAGPINTRPIPSSGEALPLVGLGSWRTFNVGNDPVAREGCAAVMRAFFASGGRMIDSSPMYGSSQPVIGHGLKTLGAPPVFSADKVWTSSGARGRAQIEVSRRHWGVPRFDLVQVHNLLAWEDHLETLAAMKAAGEIGYLGITTSEGRRHRDFERIMRDRPLDFVQLTYNPFDREAESRLLPLAAERRIAVIVNRPFQEGVLIDRLKRQKLPTFAAEIGCASWAELVLKFIVSHPGVTCAIPATSRVDHLRENMAASYGPLPDEPLRRRIADHIASL